MPASLEGILVALLVALSPADLDAVPPSQQKAVASQGMDSSLCDRFQDALARQNCVTRTSRTPEESVGAFPTELTWIAPSEQDLDGLWRFRSLR